MGENLSPMHRWHLRAADRKGRITYSPYARPGQNFIERKRHGRRRWDAHMKDMTSLGLVEPSPDGDFYVITPAGRQALDQNGGAR